MEDLKENNKPSKREQGRIDLFQIVIKDTNTIEVGSALELFIDTINMVFEKTKIGKEVKTKLTEEEYVKFFNGLVQTFMCSIYCTASKDQNQLNTRMKLVEIINSDILIGFAMKGKTNNDSK